jgi:hypothetical protein
MTDFAFLDGTLDVTHDGSATGTIVALPCLDGVANVSEVRVGDRPDGVSLKVRDPATGTWSVWWVDAATGRLGPPLRGAWHGGQVRLAGAEADGTLVAYALSDVTATSARWEQSRSGDGGRTWRVDRTMAMARRSAERPAPAPTGDFAFLARELHVEHRRRSRSAADGWETFTSTHRGASWLDGTVSTDEVGLPDGGAGMTFRVRDRDTGLWSIWWISRDRGRLEPPVVGGFDEAGVGTFVGAEDDQLVRFTWSDTTTARPRWCQELSTDGGLTWVLDWEMAFSPAEAAA